MVNERLSVVIDPHGLHRKDDYRVVPGRGLGDHLAFKQQAHGFLAL